MDTALDIMMVCARESEEVNEKCFKKKVPPKTRIHVLISRVPGVVCPRLEPAA